MYEQEEQELDEVFQQFEGKFNHRYYIRSTLCGNLDENVNVDKLIDTLIADQGGY